ncbi:hypothetical protein [Corynebacterium variabile]|uniref:hypothetical protein n=1 Tax=Corynebacterium variabile TaxID=1727 RepID=UPI003A93B81D
MTTPQFGRPTAGRHAADPAGGWGRSAAPANTTVAPVAFPPAQTQSPTPMPGYAPVPVPAQVPAQMPTPVPAARATNIPLGEYPHKKWIAAVLAAFWGAYGGANFYLGYQKRGLIQMSVTAVGVLLFFLGFLMLSVPVLGFGGFLVGASMLFGLVECVMVLMGVGPYRRDARGYDVV